MILAQKVFSVIASSCILITIIYLVKKGKLREEYTWIWVVTGFILMLLVLWYDLLLFLTKIIGAVVPTTTLFIFGILFLVILSLHFAVKISCLTDQVKNLAQEISLLQAQKDKPTGN